MNETNNVDWNVVIYKKDRRTKTGERVVGQYVFSDMSLCVVNRELKELLPLYPRESYRFDVYPKHTT